MNILHPGPITATPAKAGVYPMLRYGLMAGIDPSLRWGDDIREAAG